MIFLGVSPFDTGGPDRVVRGPVMLISGELGCVVQLERMRQKGHSHLVGTRTQSCRENKYPREVLLRPIFKRPEKERGVSPPTGQSCVIVQRFGKRKRHAERQVFQEPLASRTLSKEDDEG